MAMKIKSNKVTVVADGSYEGTINKLVQDTRKGFDYIDIYIDMGEAELKYGVPENLSVASKLGKLLVSFGCLEAELQDEQEFDIEDILVNKRVKILVKNEKVDQGTFARIMSVEPA